MPNKSWKSLPWNAIGGVTGLIAMVFTAWLFVDNHFTTIEKFEAHQIQVEEKHKANNRQSKANSLNNLIKLNWIKIGILDESIFREQQKSEPNQAQLFKWTTRVNRLSSTNATLEDQLIKLQAKIDGSE